MSSATESPKRIEVSIDKQELSLFQGEELLRRYAVSTAKNGAGEQQGSECTPRGNHIIHAMIGGDEPENSVFVGRVPTGEIYSQQLGEQHPDRDWILTRIIWLEGAEPGKNQGGEVDTLSRYIYFHGCPDEFPMGVPLSHGCIRMRNRDIVEFYDLLEGDEPVLIA